MQQSPPKGHSGRKGVPKHFPSCARGRRPFSFVVSSDGATLIVVQKNLVSGRLCAFLWNFHFNKDTNLRAFFLLDSGLKNPSQMWHCI